jgi:hypothetical protein
MLKCDLLVSKFAFSNATCAATLWLEAETLGRPLPDHDIRTTEELVGAAEVLGLRGLEDACATKLGAHESRIRRYKWSEILAHNAAGGVWIVIDGMVLDVKRWLPEHPGGAVQVVNPA